MAFVVVFFRAEEVTRQELTGPLLIGRAPDCDIVVRDILLSRHHCRIVPAEPAGWAIEDLGSKNGTLIKNELVQWSLLKDDTTIRLGKTQVRFHAGAMASAPPPPKNTAPSRRRPADPFEALSGTVDGFEYKAEGPIRDLTRLPTPRPNPADPASYANEDLYSMLTEIASSSWDSIYATASGPAAVAVVGQKQRPLPQAGVKSTDANLPPRQRNTVTDPSLQVVSTEPIAEPPPASTLDQNPAPPPRPRIRWLGPLGAVLRRARHVLTGKFLRRAG